MKKIILVTLAAAGAAVCGGQETACSDKAKNPIVEGWYADPQIRLYGDTYWIFSTYSRASYDDTLFFDLFSSKDLVTWTKHPRALDAKDIPWAWWKPSARRPARASP